MSAKKYDDNRALDYEWVIRMAHNCNRMDTYAADTGVYRRLISKANSYYAALPLENPDGTMTFTKQAYEAYTEFILSAGNIIAYLKGASYQVNRDHEDTTQEQYDELEEIPMILKPDVTIINEAIDRLKKVMVEIGLKPGA